MYSREELKQLKQEFWKSFATFCELQPYLRNRPKMWMLYNTKVRGVELKFDATRSAAYVILEVNHKKEDERLKMYEKLTWYKHEKLAHYASEAYDIKYNFECFGVFDEVEGIHARGDWDLTQHSKFSGVDLSYFDEESKERFTPHIVETSVGLGRLMLMFLDFAYTEDELGGDRRVFLKIPKHLSPIKVAVFPLLKNKPQLVEKAKEIYDSLRKEFMCEFDDNGNIGKRYRRQDEIGTPYCVTVDFDTLEKNEGVTVRDRDTGRQERISEKELVGFLKERISG